MNFRTGRRSTAIESGNGNVPLDRERIATAVVDALVWAGPEDRICGKAIGFGVDGRVAEIGDSPDVLARCDRGTTVISGGGRYLVPGFVDAHAHIRAAASALLGLDCSEYTNVEALLAGVARQCGSAAPGSWVTGVGLDPTRPGLMALDRRALDRVALDRPVRIRHRSLHAWLFNSRGLSELGLGPESVRGTIGLEVDAQGQPTGWIVDHSGWLRERMGTVTLEDELTAAVARWSSERLRDGVVAILDATVTNAAAELDALYGWRSIGILQQKVSALVGPSSGAESHRLAVGYKFMPEPGEPLEGLLAEVRQRLAGNALVAIHCTDVETLGGLVSGLGPRLRPTRGLLRVEHASQCPEEWVSLLADLDAAVVTHPGFVRAHGDRYLADVSLEPHDWLYRLRSWLSGGVRLAFASDAPAGPPAPLAWLSAATGRRTASGLPFGPAEALTGEDALAGATAWAADLSRLAGYGRLHRGGPGAAVLLNGNPFTPMGASSLSVAVVVNDGRIAFAGDL